MVAVKTEYTVRANYIQQNKLNIQLLMEALKQHPIKGMDYQVYNIEGTGIFIHISISTSKEILKEINLLDAFRAFQKELKASEPVSFPKAEYLDIIR